MMLDNAISIKPRRQMSVQFSGRADPLSLLPRRGQVLAQGRYNSVQAATNGIEFARVLSSVPRRRRGHGYAYLQFDGIGNAANEHRKVGNLFDVKLRAIENLHNAGC
jgi:uncharacterized radical SAM superfamily Fe-S cluster-containing enzyme